MLKKISISDVRLGMYIHKIDGNWMQHPFLEKRLFVIRSERSEKAAELSCRIVMD